MVITDGVLEKKHRDLITNLINGESGRVNIWMFPKIVVPPFHTPK